MKSKSNQSMKCDRGITLIALIITIILLVILAAITIRAMYNSRFMDYAINGALGYATEQNKELNIIEDVADLIGQITGEDLTLLKPTVTLKGTKGNENVYSSDVEITIKDSLDIVTLGKIEIHYIIEGLNEDREEKVEGREAVVTVTEEGIYKVKAWIQDGKGNKSEIEEVEFIIDKSKPGEPRISLTGTEGNNEYYLDNKVGVTIEAGTNIVSGVSAIKYRVEGANQVAETTEYTDTVNFDITVDGESTIYAKIISNAGVVSEEITKTMKKDSQNPNIATIAYISHGIEEITVSTKAQDVTSGLAKVEYQYSTNGTDYITKGTSNYTGTTAETINSSYKFTGLTGSTKYWLRIKVTDMAGRITEGTVITQTTNKGGLAASEFKIGDYVAYQPDTPTDATYSTYQEGLERSGWPSGNVLSRDTHLKWRVFSISGNSLILVSSTLPSDNLSLQGKNGYNNGVKLLNDACNALYKNTTLGATARNLNVDDVNEMTGYSYTIPEEDHISDSINYPAIFQYERWGSINGTYSGSLEQSEQPSNAPGSTNGWYNEGGIATTLKGRDTYYSYNIKTQTSDTIKQRLLLFQDDTTYWLGDYWLATRFSSSISGRVTKRYFGVFYQSGGAVQTNLPLCCTENGSQQVAKKLFPCIEIDLSNVHIGITGTGESSSPYSIQAK